MRALSVRQPWAWLIVNGFKGVENRDWSTQFRGRVLVHAGKTLTKRYYEETLEGLLATLGEHTPHVPRSELLQLGGVVGSVEIVDCVTSSSSPWFVGQFGFVLRNPRVLPYVPFKGQLGFFDVPWHASWGP